MSHRQPRQPYALPHSLAVLLTVFTFSPRSSTVCCRFVCMVLDTTRRVSWLNALKEQKSCLTKFGSIGPPQLGSCELAPLRRHLCSVSAPPHHEEPLGVARRWRRAGCLRWRLVCSTARAPPSPVPSLALRASRDATNGAGGSVRVNAMLTRRGRVLSSKLLSKSAPDV